MIVKSGIIQIMGKDVKYKLDDHDLLVVTGPDDVIPGGFEWTVLLNTKDLNIKKEIEAIIASHVHCVREKRETT